MNKEKRIKLRPIPFEMKDRTKEDWEYLDKIFDNKPKEEKK